MSTFSVSPKQTAAGRMREMARRVAVDAFGAREIEVPIPGFTVFMDRQLDDPTIGVRSALFLRNVAESQIYEYAKAARAAGRSWDEIGEALELPDYDFESRGAVAFRWLVEGCEPDPEPEGLPSLRTPCLWWRCGTCDQQVTDRGPFESHPDDNEFGHAAGCARHRADVGAWQARMEEE